MHDLQDPHGMHAISAYIYIYSAGDASVCRPLVSEPSACVCVCARTGPLSAIL